MTEQEREYERRQERRRAIAAQAFAARANGLAYETRELEAAYDRASKLYAAKLAGLADKQHRINERWRQLMEEVAAAGGVAFDADAALQTTDEGDDPA